jgi:hypothetical protein
MLAAAFMINGSFRRAQTAHEGEDDGSREPDQTPDERLRDHGFTHDGHLHLPLCTVATGSGRAIGPTNAGPSDPYDG